MARATGNELQGEIEIAQPAMRDPEAATLILRAFARLANSAADPLAAEESLLTALTLLAWRHGARAPPRAGPSAPVARARQRLDEAPERSATLQELAALAGVSRFQLLRGFAGDVGTTPHAYLVQRRVRLARHAPNRGAAPAAAAALAGFADQSHLTHAFVRQFGVTPARYRATVTG